MTKGNREEVSAFIKGGLGGYMKPRAIAVMAVLVPALYGTDALPTSIGVQHLTHPRNAPTILNAGLNFVQHWWGDRKSLEDQAEQALIGNFSSGQPDYAAVTAKLEAIEGYPPLFRQAFPGEA